MAVALDDPVERERHDLGVPVLQEDQTGLGAADLGDRGRDRARQQCAHGDRGLPHGFAARDRFDQVSVEQKRRTVQHGPATSG